jgi:hypothetical protein
MKKTALLSIALLFIPFILFADIVSLKLRASYHPGFLRIVVEGNESVVGKSLVYQRGQDVLLSFPDTNFSIQTEQEIVAFKKINQDTVMFSPGEFRGLEVFRLKHPTRLVIDVYIKGQQDVFPHVSPQKKGRADDLHRIESIVIDPGHGGYDNGIVKDSHKEKNTVLDIAKKLGALINSGTSRSYLTRSSDHFLSMSERVKFTGSKDAAVFVGIHIGNHRGIVMYTPVITDYKSDIVISYLYNKGQSDYMLKTGTLLKAMEKALISSFGENMVSIKPIPYSIISRIDAAALMVEFPSFKYADYSEKFNAKIANTLYKGLYIYEEIKEQ